MENNLKIKEGKSRGEEITSKLRRVLPWGLTKENNKSISGTVSFTVPVVLYSNEIIFDEILYLR